MAVRPVIDLQNETIVNDQYWKGFFPRGNILNAMSAAIFTGFKKQFSLQNGKYSGITSDTDDRIHARNSLEVVNIGKRTGDLDPGQYIVLRYLDPPWQGFYDVFKIINQNLMIGRVYLGNYPNGNRLLTFPMSRLYSFTQMTVSDHDTLYDESAVPVAADLEGVWRMDVISNANHASGVAYLQFNNQPDGRLQARYQLMGLMEGLILPTFLQDHFQLNDFSPFHDEIRKVTGDFLVGKYITSLPDGLPALVANTSLGLFHVEADNQFGFCYMLTRMGVAGDEWTALPTNTLLQPFLDTQLPDGVGMTFDEQMVGWYFPGEATPTPDRAGDLTIGARIPAAGDPQGAVACSFAVKMTIGDVNVFVDGVTHEAALQGTITFGQFEDLGGATLTLDANESRFNYLRINPLTREAEMRYHIVFQSPDGRRFQLEGVKYMQKDSSVGGNDIAELLQDYTTLYAHVFQIMPDGTAKELGTGYLKFRTFENLAATANLAGFLASFQIQGTTDLAIQFQARMRFLAFTAQFVQREYDPLAAAVVVG